MIFYRNPQLGKVKTRLAATMGDESALQIFIRLSEHTRNVTSGLPVDKVVYYSEEVQLQDIWNDGIYRKAKQSEGDLGIRMSQAFKEGFERGYERICIIGTDCPELSTSILANAFEALDSTEVVIGPARDGGYYLLGLQHPQPALFRDKQWSTPTVFRDTITDLNNAGISYTVLPILRDLDTEDDLPPDWQGWKLENK